MRKLRKVVLEMVARLEAIKPPRPPDRALQRAPAIQIAYANRRGEASAAA